MAKRPNEVGGSIESIDRYPEHLRLIGLIVTDMALAEGHLALTFWSLIDDPARADGVFWAIGNAKARADVVRGVAMETLTGSPQSIMLRDAVLSAVEKFRTVAVKRNDIAHGQWGSPAIGGPNPFISIRRPATKNPIFQKIYTVQELQEIVDNIRSTIKEIQLLNNALRYFLSEKHRPGYDYARSKVPELDAYLSKFE